MKALGLFMLFAIFFSDALSQEFCLPLPELVLTSGFGPRTHPISFQKDFHQGVDLNARSAQVRAVMAGRILSCGYQHRLGNFIRIAHGDLESIYGHLSFVLVKKDQWVDCGEVIGISGKTGCATGEHLHFSLKYLGTFINPLKFLLAITKGQTLTIQSYDTLQNTRSFALSAAGGDEF